MIAGDGQVSMGQTVIKANAKKVRRLGNGTVIAGFAGATADAFTLFERLEAKLEQHPGQLARACVELAKDWRTDRYLRRLEAMMAVADQSVSLILSGTGDVLEPEDGLIGIGSGGDYAPGRGARAHRPAAWTPRRSPAGRWRSPPRSASTPTTRSLVESAMSARSARARSSPSSTATSSASTTPSAPSPSRSATAGAGSNCPRSCARRCCPRTS